MSNSKEAPQELVRTLSVLQGTVLAVSLVVGSGVLGLPGIVLEEVGPKYAALAWIVTSLSVAPFIVVFSRLGTYFPSSPGLLSYAEYGFGKAGRNAASLMLLVSIAIGLPALLFIGGSFLQTLLGVDATWVSAFAIVILLVSAVFNSVGVRTTTQFNSISVVTMIAFILYVTFIKGAFFAKGLSVGLHSLAQLPHETSEGFALLWKGAAIIFWAFLGWENLSFGVQEVKNPTRSVPIIFGGSFILVTLLFLMPAFTSIGAAELGHQSILGAAGLVSLLEGTYLKPICSGVLCLLIMGNVNAWVFTASRLLYAEAKDGILPRKLATLSDRHVPLRCLWACTIGVVFFIALCWISHFKLSILILLVNQNFLFLFLASIWTYWKVEKSRIRFVIGPLALLSCTLFLSGFNLWILIPMGLIGLGFFIALRQRRSVVG